jgi:Ca2+-binding RTX toxin-like protein
VLRGQRGRDGLTGGPGHDILRSGEHADEVDDGPGSDWVALGSGDDIVYTRADGSRDRFVCGGGEDHVWYWGDPEPDDVWFRCEHVGDWSH